MTADQKARLLIYTLLTLLLIAGMVAAQTELRL